MGDDRTSKYRVYFSRRTRRFPKCFLQVQSAWGFPIEGSLRAFLSEHCDNFLASVAREEGDEVDLSSSDEDDLSGDPPEDGDEADPDEDGDPDPDEGELHPLNLDDVDDEGREL